MEFRAICSLPCLFARDYRSLDRRADGPRARNGAGGWLLNLLSAIALLDTVPAGPVEMGLADWRWRLNRTPHGTARSVAEHSAADTQRSD